MTGKQLSWCRTSQRQQQVSDDRDNCIEQRTERLQTKSTAARAELETFSEEMLEWPTTEVLEPHQYDHKVGGARQGDRVGLCILGLVYKTAANISLQGVATGRGDPWICMYSRVQYELQHAARDQSGTNTARWRRHRKQSVT